MKNFTFKKFMKHSLLIIILSICIFTTSCHKKKDTPQLPPETQTGAGTFGCVVNGKDYLIADYPDAFATFIYLNDIYSHGYYFTIRVSKKSPSWVMGILTDSLYVQQNGVYQLSNDPNAHGTAWALYVSGSNEYYSQSSLQGELEITKLDSIKQFVSGKFWFDAVDTVNNDLVHITDGRFDLHYTR